MLGVFGLIALLFMAALVLGVPTLLLLWIARASIPPAVAKCVAAVAFAGGSAYTLWRMEWFDVWRQGPPTLSYVVPAYGPYLALLESGKRSGRSSRS
jgi:hypothetical protein